MRLLCMYCQCDLGQSEPYDDNRISHGSCMPCALAQLRQYVRDEDYEEVAARFIRRIHEAQQLTNQ